jgi:2TM domain
MCRIAKNRWRNLCRHLEPTSALQPMGLPALSTTQRPFHPEGVGVALGIGKEGSWMREITLEDYKQADRELEREEARRGLIIHAIVYTVVMTGLIILNLTVATEFPWAVFPLVCWGFGLTLHYLFGVRWVGKVITDRQAKVEQRAAATRRAA